MKTRISLLGAMSVACFIVAPVGAQPLPVERVTPKINNLSLKAVAPDVAEKLAMPAKPIVLHLNDVTLEAALNELENQSGVALDLGYGDKEVLNKKLSLDLQTRFFQPAFDAIIDEAGVKGSLQRFGRNEGWNVRFGQDDNEKISGPQAGVGPFQVKLQSVDSNFRETVKLNADGKPTRSQERSFSVSFDSRTDPIVNVTGTPLFILKRVEDDKGRSLLDTKSNQWLRYDFDNNWYGARPQSFQAPASDAKSLARIEGTTIYVVPTERQRWEIADITNNKNAVHEFESDGRTVTATIKSASLEGTVLNVSFEMSAPPAGNEPGQRGPLFSFGQIGKTVHLEDENGTVFRLGSSSISSGNDKFSMRGEFVKADNRRTRATDEDGTRPPVEIVEPIKLVFDGPTQWVQTEVPFSFTDVPLP